MPVEVDVAVYDPVIHALRGRHLADLPRLLRRGRYRDHSPVVLTPDPRKIHRRTSRQVDHRPLRHGPPEFAARSVGQREITRRKNTSVVADPGGNRIVRILLRAPVDLDRHARQNPRVVVGIQYVHTEALAVGIHPRRVENRRPQRRQRRPKREVDLLGLDPVFVKRFFCHIRCFNTTKIKNFTIFTEHRRRFGSVKSENFRFRLPLYTPFTIFVYNINP